MLLKITKVTWQPNKKHVCRAGEIIQDESLTFQAATSVLDPEHCTSPTSITKNDHETQEPEISQEHNQMCIHPTKTKTMT